MSSPFDDADAEYLILVNGEGQYSLWPERVPVPGGWSVADRGGRRAACSNWLDAHWTDMRPAAFSQP